MKKTRRASILAAMAGLAASLFCPALHAGTPAARGGDALRSAIVKHPYTWDHDKTHYDIEFSSDGSGKSPKSGFKWRVINAQEVEITWLKASGEPSGDTAHLKFNPDYSAYTGIHHGEKIIAVKGHELAQKNMETVKSLIEVLAETAPATTESVLAPLDAKIPPKLRADITTMREKLLDEAAKAPAAPADAYKVAAQLSNAWIAALDERDKTVAAESKTAPMGTANMEAGRPVHPGELSLEQEGIDAQKKKEDDAKQNAFFTDAQKKQWAKRCGELHPSFDQLYAQMAEIRRKGQ